jgi:competence protein ComEA
MPVISIWRVSWSTVSRSPSAPGGGDVGLLNLNAATVQQLEALPGIGPVLAQRIVQWRTDNGPFPDVEILGEVSGIGDVLMEQLRPLVAV